MSFSQDKEQSLGLGNGENGSNCFKRQEDGIIRSPLTIVLNIRDILTRSVFLIYIFIFIFIMHLITYEKGRNYIDGFKYRLCLQYCLSDLYGSIRAFLYRKRPLQQNGDMRKRDGRENCIYVECSYCSYKGTCPSPSRPPPFPEIASLLGVSQVALFRYGSVPNRILILLIFH